MASNSNSHTNHNYNDHAYYPNAHHLPRQTRSPESYASLARRNGAAEMLQSYEKVSWLAFQRVESIAQTRLYLQNIIAGFNPDDPRGNPVEWADSTYQQQRRRTDGEAGGGGGGKGKARATTNGEESSTGGEGSSTSGTGARRGASGTPRRKPASGGGGGGG